MLALVHWAIPSTHSLTNELWPWVIFAHYSESTQADIKNSSHFTSHSERGGRGLLILEVLVGVHNMHAICMYSAKGSTHKVHMLSREFWIVWIYFWTLYKVAHIQCTLSHTRDFFFFLNKRTSLGTLAWVFKCYNFLVENGDVCVKMQIKPYIHTLHIIYLKILIL